jgi:hypothetical protein
MSPRCLLLLLLLLLLVAGLRPRNGPCAGALRCSGCSGQLGSGISHGALGLSASSQSPGRRNRKERLGHSANPVARAMFVSYGCDALAIATTAVTDQTMPRPRWGFAQIRNTVLNLCRLLRAFAASSDPGVPRPQSDTRSGHRIIMLSHLHSVWLAPVQILLAPFRHWAGVATDERGMVVAAVSPQKCDSPE